MLDFMQLQPGQRLRLRDGRLGEVVENIGDGIWVQLRILAGDDDEELVHCEDVAGLAEAA